MIRKAMLPLFLIFILTCNHVRALFLAARSLSTSWLAWLSTVTVQTLRLLESWNRQKPAEISRGKLEHPVIRYLSWDTGSRCVWQFRLRQSRRLERNFKSTKEIHWFASLSLPWLALVDRRSEYRRCSGREFLTISNWTRWLCSSWTWNRQDCTFRWRITRMPWNKRRVCEVKLHRIYTISDKYLETIWFEVKTKVARPLEHKAS